MTDNKNSKIITVLPGKVHAANGTEKGEINLQWDAVTKARNYVLQLSVNKPANWKHIDIVTGPQYTINNLSSGKKYFFRIAPVFDTGQGSWSEPEEKKAR